MHSMTAEVWFVRVSFLPSFHYGLEIFQGGARQYEATIRATATFSLLFRDNQLVIVGAGVIFSPVLGQLGWTFL